MNESDQTLALVNRVFNAFGNHDIDTFQSLLAQNAVLDIRGGQKTLTGPDDIVAAVSRTLDLIPDVSISIKNIFASGTDAVAEVVREGIYVGAAPGLDSNETETVERKVSLPECAVFKLQDGKIVRMTVYTDQLDTLRQFGILPEDT